MLRLFNCKKLKLFSKFKPTAGPLCELCQTVLTAAKSLIASNQSEVNNKQI